MSTTKGELTGRGDLEGEDTSGTNLLHTGEGGNLYRGGRYQDKETTSQ